MCRLHADRASEFMGKRRSYAEKHAIAEIYVSTQEGLCSGNQLVSTLKL